jgi:hypothetical protein
MSIALDDAVDRLNVALVERDRLEGCLHTAAGTTGEYAAYRLLWDAREEVMARQALVDNMIGGRVGNQAWVNGRAVGGEGSIFRGAEG